MGWKQFPLAMAVTVAVAGGFFSSPVLADPPTRIPAHEVREPFFSFMISLAEGDSLGTWSGTGLTTLLAAYPQESRFPLSLISSVTRRPAEGAERQQRRDHQVSRIWELELTGDLDRPMPYSILGYHPGSLRLSQRMVFSEWQLGDLNLRYADGDQTVRQTVGDVRVLRLDQGHLILDVDAVIDALLGQALDDSWTLGLVLAKGPTRRLALAVNVGREGRPLYGEMHLGLDRIMAHGRPLAKSLCRTCRPWSRPLPGQPSRAWQTSE